MDKEYKSSPELGVFFVPKVGIEPTYPRVHDFESCASAYSATSAVKLRIPKPACGSRKWQVLAHMFPHILFTMKGM